MSTRAPKFMVIGLFLAMVATPALLQIGVELRRGERPAALRILSTRPTERNLRAYEKSVQDTSVTARALRPWMQAAQFFALHDAGEKALIGADGWLFYQPGVDYLTQRAKPGDSTVADAVKAVARFRDDLALRGTQLLVMPAPNKESIYPDKLWHGAIPPGGSAIGTETREFLARCRAEGVATVDLFELYSRARGSAETPLYLARDSHWSPAGIKLAADAVAAGILERGWLTAGGSVYGALRAPVRELGDLVRMIRSPQIEACVAPEEIATEQIVRRDTGAVFADDPGPEVLVLGDSFVRMFQRDAPGGAGFVAHLALALGRPVAGIISDGGASTLVRQDLFRRPRMLDHAKVVVWEFVERDIRQGTEGWQIVPLPPGQSRARISSFAE